MPTPVIATLVGDDLSSEEERPLPISQAVGLPTGSRTVVGPGLFLANPDGPMLLRGLQPGGCPVSLSAAGSGMHIRFCLAGRSNRLSSVSKVVVVVLVALGLVIVGAVVWLGQPHLTTDVARYGFRFVAEVGETRSFGKVVLFNGGASPVELRAVRVDNLPSGIAFLGAVAMDTKDVEVAAPVFADSHPPAEFSGRAYRPVSGYVLEPGRAVRLYLGLRVETPGEHTMGPIIVDYGPPFLVRSATLDYTLRICGPAADYRRGDVVVGCPIPD